MLAGKVLEEITQDFSDNKKHPWSSCLIQIPGAVGWEMRVQLKKKQTQKTRLGDAAISSQTTSTSKCSWTFFNLGYTMRSSKGIVEATTESFSWRFRTFIQKYTNYCTMQKCNAKCQISGISNCCRSS